MAQPRRNVSIPVIGGVACRSTSRPIWAPNARA
jgi:hypothetical protein